MHNRIEVILMDESGDQPRPTTSEAIQNSLKSYLKQGQVDPSTGERRAPIAPLIRPGATPLKDASSQMQGKDTKK